MRALRTAVVLVLALALPAPVLAADLEVGGAVDVEVGGQELCTNSTADSASRAVMSGLTSRTVLTASTVCAR